MVNTVLSTAISGLNSASERISRAAENISDPRAADSSGGGGSSLPKDIVDIKGAEVAYRANLEVIEVQGELQDELLKVFDKKV